MKYINYKKINIYVCIYMYIYIYILYFTYIIFLSPIPPGYLYNGNKVKPLHTIFLKQLIM